MAPIAFKSLNRLSREAIIDLALKWLQDGHTSSPYLLCNRTGFEADEEDYQHTPAESIEELRDFYRGLRSDATQGSKRDVVDRIIDGDWRRGLSLHQHAMIDFACLEQNDAALRWSALKLVPLETGGQRLFNDDTSQPSKKKRKLSHDFTEKTYAQVSPQAFLSALKAEISPLVKAHYHLHNMPSPCNLTVLRLYISPTSSFAPRRSKTPRRAKHATDTGRIMYIALPDSCPHVYISISGSSSSASHRSKGSARDAKQKVLAKVDIAAMKRIVLEAIPKALSRPQQRWALESTKLVARSLKTMCDLRGNQKPGTGGGAYSLFAEVESAIDKSPVDVQTADAEAERDDRQRLIEQRFGHMHGSHYAALDRIHFKSTPTFQSLDTGEDDGDTSMQPAEREEAGVFLTFSGSDVFGGLKTLAQLGPQYIDVEKMPAWMTGEFGLSNLTA